MARTSKSKAAKTKSKAKTKSAKTVEVAAPVVETTAETVEKVVTLTDDFQSLLATVNSLRSQLTSVCSQIRTLQKRAERELKAANKANKKRRKKTDRKPSGFVKPTEISNELATFLNKEHGTEMARTQVTKEINVYIRAHNLQDPKNGRRILADKPLRKLLRLDKNTELTYFNLQRYMKPHFKSASNPSVNAK